MPSEQPKIMAAGFTEILLKPFSRSALQALISRYTNPTNLFTAE